MDNSVYIERYEVQKDLYVYQSLTKEECEAILRYAIKAADLRWGQPGFKGTSKKKLKDAFFLGGCGETACAKLFGHKQSELDFSVGGDARDYSHADLKSIGYEVGVKTSRYRLAPMVVLKDLWKDGRCGDEIFCTVFDEDIERDEKGSIISVKGVWINGLATESKIKEFQSRDLIKDKDNPKYKDRAGFYGFDKLITFHDEASRFVFDYFYSMKEAC